MLSQHSCFEHRGDQRAAGRQEHCELRSSGRDTISRISARSVAACSTDHLRDFLSLQRGDGEVRIRR